MNVPTTGEIEAYLDGELPEERMQQIDALASADRELAAKIAVIGHLTGFIACQCDEDTLHGSDSESAAVTHRAGAGSRARRWLGFPAHPPAFVAAGLLVLAGFIIFGVCLQRTHAAYAQVKEALEQTTAALEQARKGELTDAFARDWLDPTKWRTGRRTTTAQDGYARLNDRGSLLTVHEFEGPIAIELEWRWIDIAGDIAYRDALTVAFHTSGEHADQHPFRVQDGIEVGFLTHGGQVALASPTDGHFTHLTPVAAFPMPAGKWHRIRIADDGREIAVYLSGPAIDKRTEGKPVLSAPYTGNFRKHHIAIYNREPVAGALHESHIRNVVIWPLGRGIVE